MRAGRRCPLPWLMSMGVTLLLSGCGTNVMYLLKEESRIVAEADPLLVSAEASGSGMEQQVYEAEAAKDAACEFLHAAVFDRFNRDPSFFEQFVSDLSSAVVLIVPIGQIEECAEAFDTYSAAVDNLANSMQSAAGLPQPDSAAEIESGIN